MNTAIVGAQWGDEAKGSITHYLSPNYDWVIRWGGGANAGHTIYRDGIKYVHNLLPSFDWRSKNVKAFLASGMVIDIEQLHKEIMLLWNINSILPSRIYVDPDAFLVLPSHKLEDAASNSHIGTTNRGIGPAYKSKINRDGVRIRDILNGTTTIYSNLIYELIKVGVHFKSMLELTHMMSKSRLLFEGSQGVMLDINHGTYPYVSCSDATVSGIYSNGFHFVKLNQVYGIAKCYLTKVGEGPFPTEIFGNDAELLRNKGAEFGATTGRPRRIGWLDLPALEYACKKGGITDLILTKLDILNGMKKIPVGVFYDKMPMSSYDFFNPKITYHDVNGWDDPKNKDQISEFISIVVKFTGRNVRLVSSGINPSDIVSW